MAAGSALWHQGRMGMVGGMLWTPFRYVCTWQSLLLLSWSRKSHHSAPYAVVLQVPKGGVGHAHCTVGSCIIQQQGLSLLLSLISSSLPLVVGLLISTEPGKGEVAAEIPSSTSTMTYSILYSHSYSPSPLWYTLPKLHTQDRTKILFSKMCTKFMAKRCNLKPMIRSKLRRNKRREKSSILHHMELGLRTGSGHRKQRRGEVRRVFGAELCHPHLYVEVVIPRTSCCGCIWI